MKVKFDIEPVYGDNDKYINTKIKIYEDKVNTNFQGKKLPKENASHKCLSMIMLDPLMKTQANHPLIIVKHYWKNKNMKQKKNKMENRSMMI